MKYLLVLFVGLVFLTSSCGTSDSTGEAALGDTLTTESGLRYVYQKHGTGRQIETGSEVATYLSLQVNNKVIWNTSDSPDSAFVFVAGKSSLIKGFAEVVMLLREGDEIAAVLPAEIAYGAQGSGNDIPPNATLVYDQFKVLRVTAPKFTMADSLFAAMQRQGADGLKREFTRITTTSDSNRYYHDAQQWRLLWNQLTDAGMHNEALAAIDFFNQDNSSGYRLYRVRSYNNLGLYQRGIDSLTALLKADSTLQKSPRVTALLDEMKSKLAK